MTKQTVEPKTEVQLDAFSEELEHALQNLEQLPPDQQADVIARIPAMLQSLMALFASELRPVTKDAEKHAQRLIISMANYLGGMHTYIPRNDRLITLLRNIAIYNAQCRGATIKELAQKHGLTDVQIYTIIREQTHAERARRQLGLFKD